MSLDSNSGETDGDWQYEGIDEIGIEGVEKMLERRRTRCVVMLSTDIERCFVLMLGLLGEGEEDVSLRADA